MSDLTKVVSSGNGIEIVTKSNPKPDLLRVARRLVLQDQALRDAFVKTRTEELSSDFLAQELTNQFTPFLVDDSGGVSLAEVEDLARYLADEYFQLGQGILVTSPETGRAVAILNEKDLYQPAPVTREDGRIVSRSIALRPEIESFLTHRKFEDASESLQAQEYGLRLAAVGNHSPTAALAVTRAGRAETLAKLSASLPTILEKPQKGFMESFLGHFKLLPFEEEPGRAFNCLEVGCSSYWTMSMVDWRAKSPTFDALHAISLGVGANWVRQVARNLFVLLQNDENILPEVLLEKRLGEGTWICSPNVGVYFRGLNPSTVILPVGTSDRYALWVQGDAGYLSLDPKGYGAKHREVSARWDVSTEASGRLWFDPAKIEVIGLREIPVTGTSVDDRTL